MEEKNRCKFDIVAFLAVLILIVFMGCMCVAVAFGIKQQKNLLNVAYADSTDGVVENNLFLKSFDFDFNVSTNGVFYDDTFVSYLFDGDINNGDSIQVNSIIRSATSTRWSNLIFRFKNLPISTYTFSVYVSSLSADLLISARNNNPISQTFTNSGVLSITFTNDMTNFDLWFALTSVGQATFNWLKLEQGSSFTGYVPKDYTNYGYNQGFQDGSSLVSGYQNYVHISDLDWSSFPPDNFITDFTFNGKSYRFDNYQSGLSLYLGNYNQVGFGYSTVSNTYVGLKFSSSNLYGNIMITMPWVDRGDKSLKLVFEVVETGELLSITNDDTLHWFYNSSSVGKWFIPSAYTSFYDIYNITVSVFFPTQVNIYFLPETDILGGYSTSEVNSRMAYLCYPYSADYADIYSTQNSTALSSFDEGFYAGVEKGNKDAQEANAQAVANARSAGYERGKREALEDANDYSFMGLLGAVFDAPIKSFQGLLNFDVLGVNMKSFVLALLSLSVIIIIIKIALGGK